MQQEDIYYKKYMKYKQKYLLLQEQMGGFNSLKNALENGLEKGLEKTIKKSVQFLDEGNIIRKSVVELYKDNDENKGTKEPIGTRIKNILINNINSGKYTNDVKKALINLIGNFEFTIPGIYKLIGDFKEVGITIIKNKLIKVIESNLDEKSSKTYIPILENFIKGETAPKAFISRSKDILKDVIIQNIDKLPNGTISEQELSLMRIQLLPLRASLELLDSPFGYFTPLYPLKQIAPNIILNARKLLDMLTSGTINKNILKDLVNTIFL
jgi:hypothetical protein